MVAPGALVLLMPVVFGVFFGTHALAGLVCTLMRSWKQRGPFYSLAR